MRDYGADATRFAIVSQMHGGQDVRFSIECDDARKFCNKLWQAMRFALITFPELGEGRLSIRPLQSGEERGEQNGLDLADRWILDGLAQAVERIEKAAAEYDFSEWAQALYTFIKNQLCDVYIEIAKDKAPSRAGVLARALAAAMQLLHPIMPFVTEELWQHLPHEKDRIERSGWPHDAGRLDPAARAEMSRLLEFAQTVRELRAVPKLPYRELRDVMVAGADGPLLALLQREPTIIRTLARAERVSIADGTSQPSLSARMGNVEVLLPVDASFVEREQLLLRKEMEKHRSEVETLDRKLASSGFKEKAPPAVVEKEEARLAQLRATLAKSSERLASLGATSQSLG